MAGCAGGRWVSKGTTLHSSASAIPTCNPLPLLTIPPWVQDAYYIHFSAVVGKPWDVANQSLAVVEEAAPPCPGRCADHEAFVSLYRTYFLESQVCEQQTEQPKGQGPVLAS